jgi:hypothetical protein
LGSELSSDFLNLLKHKKDDADTHQQSNLLLDINEKKLMNDSHSFTSQDNAFDMNLLYLPIKTLFLDKNSNKLTVTKPLGEVIGLTENGDPIYEG